MTRKLAQAVAAAPRSTVTGDFARHASARSRGLTGSNAGGRWGPSGGYPVLYLGRPNDSVIAESYRHLVDPFAAEGMTGDLVAPRRLVVCRVAAKEILDLRELEARALVGLGDQHVLSDVGKYEECVAVARVAHQLGLHGVIAPSASGLGETLALFEQHLTAEELPVVVGEEIWEVLPADPRRLRIVRGDEGRA